MRASTLRSHHNLDTPPLSPTSSADDVHSHFDDAKLPASPAPQTPGEPIDVDVKQIPRSGKLVLRVDQELQRLLIGAHEDGRKREKKFGDLVFTPRFTAFDRAGDQPKSPFHGFFVLIWFVHPPPASEIVSC